MLFLCMKKSYQEIANLCFSKKELAIKIFKKFVDNARHYKKINYFIQSNNLDISHFSRNGFENRKLIYKNCPVCKKEFLTNKHKGSWTFTCSKACANTYFRSGKNHPNFKRETYKSICFKHHKKQCVVCGENKIVAVHHYDLNHNNNDPKNLIPLCPTHHLYCHSKYKNEVLPLIKKYIKNKWQEKRHEPILKEK